jgi:hypothetical protein
MVRVGSFGAGALAVLTALLVLAGPSSFARADVPSPVTANPSYALFAAPNGKPFVRLDPETLADAPNASLLDFGESYPNWVLSADGSVSARLDQSSGVIAIRSGLTGSVRRRIQPATTVFAQALSRDGARLLTQVPMSCSPSGCTAPVWYVYDTADGRLVSKVTGDDQGYGGDAFLDPAGSRLYRPTFARGGQAVGPWPLQLVAYDLIAAAGQEIGRLTLPTVPAGIWYDRVIDQIPVEETLMPAIALSSDGGTIVVAHADTDALTLIDANALRVERTVDVSRPASRAQRVLGWLGLMPQPAEAKFMNGRRLSAVFAADGSLLYVYGAEGTVGADVSDVREQGLGLRAIDPATGAIVGEALGDQELDAVFPAPDGSGVYANGPSIPWAVATGEPPDRLVRLAPRSLEVLATRDFPDRRSVALIPDAP